jgi:hypothetical protein
MPAPLAFALGAVAVVAVSAAGKALGQYLFHHSAIYPKES